MRTSDRVAQALLLTLTLLTLVLGVGVITATASAQELPGDGNATTTEPSTETYDQLGDLVVHSYEYSDGEMTIDMTWRGERPDQLTLTEMLELDSAGSTQISFKQVRLYPDRRTEVTIAAEKSSGTAAVLLTTEQSVEANEALVLQEGDGADRDPIPFGWASALIGLAAIGGAGLTFVATARSYTDDDEGERRERIA